MLSTKKYYVVLFFFSPLFTTPVLSQSEIRGAVNKTAPYGIPPATFNSLTSNPTQQGTYSSGGFNISAEGSATSQIDGWLLNVAVTADVPLKDAEAAANGSVDGSKVMEATVLSLLAPANLTTYNKKKWTICAMVFPRVNTTAVALQRQTQVGVNNSTSTNSTDAACSTWLGEQCERQISGVNTYGSGKDHCQGTVSLSPTCSQYFENGEGLGTAFYAIEDGRFYAFGSAPTNAENRSAISEAENHVWPVKMTWTESNGNSGGSFMQCIQANSSDAALPNVVGHPSSGSSRISVGMTKWQVEVMLAIVVALLV